MKKLWRGLSPGQLILGISGIVSFLLFLILAVVSAGMSSSQLSQQMASRWSDKKDVAQISCFFSPNAQMSVDRILQFEHDLDKALETDSITSDSENANARLWADAYSADGKITLSNGNTSVEADAIGIGGDFFLFHPLKLLNGSFFSGNDINQDYCVIDEDMAWQLFGSNDVAGQTVTIQGIPHIVTGVIRRDEGRLEKAAGLDATVVYVSYETLTKYGRSNGLNHYEIVMPNPVSKYAFNYVKENIGVEEKEFELVENSKRYSFLEKVKRLGTLGTRSMNGKAIIYPYWENIARGYEDLLNLTLFGMLLFLLYPLVLLVILLRVLWKHKSWTVRGVYLSLKDKAERMCEKNRERRKAGKSEGKGKKQRKKHRKNREDDWDFEED